MASAAFVVAIVAALVMYLLLARRQWFHADEWDFLAGRNAGSLHDLFTPHNEHWSTLPILAFRGLFQLFGVRTYFPYLLLIVILHLAVACLLRIVMLRAHVQNWIATAAAVLFVFFGRGYDNIVYAFQIGFVGALLFGLTQLLLADHDGTIDNRDWLGLIAGFCALLCSGVAVTMVAVVGLATLIRRGWRIAVFHVAPLAAVYALWLLTMARHRYSARAGFGEIVHFVTTDVRAAFGALGQVAGLGVLLGAALVVGLVVAWTPLTADERRKRAAAPASLLIGALLFLAITAIGRAGSRGGVFLRQPSTSSRYLHIVAALVIPALAVAIDAIARRFGTVGTVAAVMAFAIGIPGNVRAVHRNLDSTVPAVRIYRSALATTPRLPVSRVLPPTYEPFTPYVPTVTIAWLRASAASGKLPNVKPLTAREASVFSLGLIVRSVDAPSSPIGPCDRIAAARDASFGQGDVILLDPGAAIALTYFDLGVAAEPPVLYRATDHARVLRMLTGPVRLRIVPSGPGRSLVCHAR